MGVREDQQQGALALLFMGLVVCGLSALAQVPRSQEPRIPWINQESDTSVLEITGDSEKAGIYFFPPSANLEVILIDLEIADVVSAERLREALSTGDAALTLLWRRGDAKLVEMAAVKRLALGLLINLNKATEEELTAVPGIGTKTAAQIVKLRRIREGFRSIAELKEVPGINERKLETLKGYLMTGNVGESAGGWRTVGLEGHTIQ